MKSLLLALMMCAAPAWAAGTWKTVEIYSSPLVVEAGQTRSAYLNQSYPIYKLIIQAESTGGSNALFDVMINGETFGTIMTPGADPSYIVTVDQTTNAIQFRSLSGGGFKISRIVAVLGKPPKNRPAPGDLPTMNDITSLSLRTIDVVTKMESLASPQEQWKYTLPIKKSAGNLYSLAYAHGAYDWTVYYACLSLMKTIDAAKTFLDQQMARDSSYELMVALLTIRAQLDEWTR